MSGLEVNKILASIILAVLIVTLIGHFGDLIIDTKHHDEKETAYKIDVEEMSTSDDSTAKKEEVIEPISALLTSASIENGEKIFKKCSTCHNYEKGSANKVGPHLWNLINRPKELAEDHSAEWDAWRHAIQHLKNEKDDFDIFVSLPTTAPLRKDIDVINRINALNKDIDIVVSIVKSQKSPWFNMVYRNQNSEIKLINLI